MKIDMGGPGGVVKFEDSNERGSVEIRPDCSGGCHVFARCEDDDGVREAVAYYQSANEIDGAHTKGRPTLSVYATTAATALGRREIFGASAEHAIQTIFWEVAIAPMNTNGWFARIFPKKAAWYRKTIEHTPGLRYGDEHRTFNPQCGELRDGTLTSDPVPA